MKRQDIEASITCFPICDYAFIQIKDIPFKEEVRHICRTECPRYGKSWSCPPAVGTVEECRSRCEAYEGGFLFTTMTEVSDMENMEELLSTRKEHEELTRRIKDLFIKQHQELLVLSTESCALCEDCTWPDAPCRFPDTLYPSIESYCVEVNRLASTAGIHYINGENTVTYFGCIMY